MSGGGISNMIGQVGQPASSSGGFSNGGGQQQTQPQMNWQTGQPVAQPTQPAYQPTGPNSGWNRPMFATDPSTMSPTQNWWTNTQMGQQAGGQEGLNQTLRDQIKGGMGNYGNMVNYANRMGISQGDIQQAIGGGNDVYTYMNRPNYQQYSPNGQFNQPIYQSNYQNYNTGNSMGVSQYGQGPDYYGMGLAQQMNTPFNPYTNSYQTPFSAQQAQPNYGSSQPIVSRSAGMRGTPNVVRRAEGGIASLMDDAE